MRSSVSFLILSLSLAAPALGQELRKAETAKVVVTQPKVAPKAKTAAKVAAPIRIDREAQETARRARIAVNERRMSDKRRDMIASLDRILAQAGPRYAARYARLFQRAELEWEEAKYQYFVARKAYEETTARLPADAKAPPEPKPDFSAAIATYRKIVAENPEFERSAEVRYHLGYALIQADKAEEAVEALTAVATETPSSALIPDALRTMGDLWFDRGRFVAAQKSYEQLIAKFPQSRDADYARYKLAWCLHNQRNYQDAIRTFAKLIETPPGRPASELRDQALKDVIASFAEIDGGWKMAQQYFQRVLGEAGMRLQMERFAYALSAQDKNYETLELLGWLLGRDARAAEAPRYHRISIDVLKKLGQPAFYDSELRKILVFYDPAGPWCQANQGNARAVAEGEAIAEEALDFVGTYHHAEAQRLRDEERYKAAARAYGEFLQRFPRSARCYKVNYHLAEILFRIGDYEPAAARYREVVTRGAGELFADAAYKVLYCYSEMMKKLGLDRELTRPDEAGAIARTALADIEKKFIAASDEFVRTVPKSDHGPLVMFKAAKTYYLHGEFAQAAKRFEYILEQAPKHKYAAYAGTLTLDCYNRVQDWPGIAKWARYLLRVKNFQHKSQRELREIVAQSAVKAAQILEQRGDFEPAAEAMMAVVEEFPKSDTADRAMFNAAALYEKAQKAKRAVELYERVRKTFPKGEFAARATFVLGSMHEARADYKKAVQEYERAVAGARTVQTADALYNAALLRQLLGDNLRAAELFRKYAEVFPDRADAWDVFLRAGAALERAGKPKEAAALYEEYVRRAPGAGGRRGVEALTRAGVLVRQRDPAAAAALFARALDMFGKARLQPGGPQAAFAAQARFLVGEARFAEFEQVKLELPEKELQKRIGEKARRMKTAVEAYLQVAKLKAPEWTAAAAFKIGLCYQRFAEALVEAPVPQNMSDEEKEIYRAGLQERAQPIEDQAQKAFETAVRFARAARAYNQWTALSAEHLAQYRSAEFPATDVKLPTDRPHQATLETGGVR
ncbi:MAG: tetratricopeptide repeat protein [Deltaproteobacteria bacterium]|nr:tetratricopeptide repeat protein [Deltaproteobacteria bacterium]